jgi:AcrR family transcriptional regulator
MKKEYRNSSRTEKMIRSAFVDLIGEKKVISNISVAELAERADIAKSTFYNHYDDIYAVAEEMINEILGDLGRIIDAMDADHTADYHVYIRSIFAYLKQNEEIYRKLSSSPDANFYLNKIKNVITKRVFSNVKSPFLSDNKAIRHVQISFLANACVDTMVDYFRGNIDMKFDDFENVIMGILDKMV